LGKAKRLLWHWNWSLVLSKAKVEWPNTTCSTLESKTSRKEVAHRRPPFPTRSISRRERQDRAKGGRNSPPSPPVNVARSKMPDFSPPAAQIPGVYHRKIGDIVVSAVSDGFLDGNLDVLTRMDREVARKILEDHFRPVRRGSVNAFLIF